MNEIPPGDTSPTGPDGPPAAAPEPVPPPPAPERDPAGLPGDAPHAGPADDDTPDPSDTADAAPAAPGAGGPGAPAPEKRRRVRKPPPAPPPPPPINPAAALPATDAPQLPPGLTAEAAVLDYKVNLENFYGPLDLLLHLVREQEVSIETISISQVADQYCRYLEMMKALDINLAGEFLVMAATLMAIKARALVPREALEEAAAQEDPSLELIKKLIEYKRFKERARRFGALAEVRARRFARGVPSAAVKEAAEPEPLKELALWPLVSLFAKITRSIRLDVAISILYADVPLERFMEMVLERLRIAGEMRFSDLAGQTDRMKVIGTFLAILQLAKDQHVSIEQDEASGEIRVALVDEEDELMPPAPPPAETGTPPSGVLPAPPAEEAPPTHADTRHPQDAAVPLQPPPDAAPQPATPDVPPDTT